MCSSSDITQGANPRYIQYLYLNEQSDIWSSSIRIYQLSSTNTAGLVATHDLRHISNWMKPDLFDFAVVSIQEIGTFAYGYNCRVSVCYSPVNQHELPCHNNSCCGLFNGNERYGNVCVIWASWNQRAICCWWWVRLKSGRLSSHFYLIGYKAFRCKRMECDLLASFQFSQ